MSRRILIRHGQSAYNAGETDDYDSDLTERGHHQIEDACLHAKGVMGLEWPCVTLHSFKGFASPYLRCLRTALPIHNRWEVPMTVDHRCGEFPDLSQRFQTFHRMPRRLPDFPTYTWTRFPETGFDWTGRPLEVFWADLEAFARDLPEDAVVVSHMTTVQGLAAILTGQDRESLRGTEVSNSSLTLIEDGQLVFIGRR